MCNELTKFKLFFISGYFEGKLKLLSRLMISTPKISTPFLTSRKCAYYEWAQ